MKRQTKSKSNPKPALSRANLEFIINLAEEMAAMTGYLNQGYPAEVKRIAKLLRNARAEWTQQKKAVLQRPVARDRLALWAHLVSEHAACVGLDLTAKALIEFHRHEHSGPGTIRNHPAKSRTATIAKIIYVMSEADTGVVSMEDGYFQLHYQLVCDEAKRRGIALENTPKE